MAKVRIYELAKELDVTTKYLINILLVEFDIKVKNHMSVIDEEDAELLKELLSNSDSKAKMGANDIANEYEEFEDTDAIKAAKKKKNKRNPDSSAQTQSKEDDMEDEDDDSNVIELVENEITVGELAEKLGESATDVIKQLMFCGVMAGINQNIDFNTAEKVGEKFNVSIVKKSIDEDEKLKDQEEDDEDSDSIKRSPIVTVMGHVDHGKTSLLDAIKQTRVTASEAGGITQHVAAYTVKIKGEKITFLDTPGHAAFTAMRARGAQVTDVVILVVAADDGIMPQTVEAINHCKAAGVEIIVAINKIDKPAANIDKVKQELTEYNLIPEDWGGSTICVPVSAHTKEGIDTLLEMVLLTSEILELKANPERKARGTVIEAELDKGKGAIATLIVQNGTLHVGDSIVVGTSYGRIRAMLDDTGKNIKKAGPSTPIAVLGLSEVPEAGDKFVVMKDEKTARNTAENRRQNMREQRLMKSHKVSLEDLYKQIQEGSIKELSLVVKADVQGSVEALSQSLEKLSTDNVKVRVIHGATGAITEADVILASASNAIILGFNVRPDANAVSLADKDEVDIKTYRVIYDAIDDVKDAMVGLLDPEFKEVILGSCEIRQVYKISNIGTIAGCYVLNGKLTRNCSVRIVRDGIVIFESTLASLKRFKDDVKEVNSGYECGLSIEKFNDIKEGDIVEAFTMEEIKPQSL
ncbi:bacterial translation initiation factor 2 (bIF-2) [Hathewaya proteolytica DSM 3090]|uniref:Translation initiation factor IF-2 n=1 Tax=Hathewaya proteolytica DSM 3090 TaxID=1121331 RepID=A0A1M6J5K5_9CLOT|nr:translation initiation factor IF-2 [Hathewaya proteolytica]SHJ41980.1 bacterial translation initiation factor 2 (bIF-2) [Hathewaya proteolytica DSM 3090]